MRPRVCAHVRVAFARNTQRPGGLPRAERTASACVLVPSKQGNLEHAEGASNKHNLLPLSSHTWLGIMQRGRLCGPAAGRREREDLPGHVPACVCEQTREAFHHFTALLRNDRRLLSVLPNVEQNVCAGNLGEGF